MLWNLVSAGLNAERSVPEHAVLVMHLDDRRCRIVQVAQPRVRVLVQRRLEPLPFRLLEQRMKLTSPELLAPPPAPAARRRVRLGSRCWR